MNDALKKYENYKKGVLKEEATTATGVPMHRCQHVFLFLSDKADVLVIFLGSLLKFSPENSALQSSYKA